MSSVSLPKAWRGLNAGSCAPLPLPVCPQPRLLKPSSAYVPVLSSRPLRRLRRPPMSRAPLPNSGVTSVGETWSASWEGITPPSSLILAHVPLPLSSLFLRQLASFRESLQVVPSPCCSRQLPDVISESPSLDAGSRSPAVHRVLAPVSSTVSSAFPKRRMGRLPASTPAHNDFSQAQFRGCRYFVMFRPPSLLAPRVVPTAAKTAAGQLGLLRPGLLCFVTSAHTGYANRLNTGN